MSKQLPLKPSLEFDKKQAKSLLKAFQSGKPSAIQRVQEFLPHVYHQSLEQVRDFPLQLTQAQLVVAREYGFQSWGSLRLEIKLRNHDYRAKLEQFKRAIYASDVKQVESLLSDNADLRDSINDPLFSFDTPAILAAKHNLELVDVLIQYGADINAKSQWWAGAFHVLEGTDSKLVSQLMERGASVIPHVAAEQGWLDWLINAYAENPAMVHQRGGDGKTPLHYATDPTVIDWLLEHGADINARDLDHQSTPLQWLASGEDWKPVRHLIAKGAQIDIFVAAALGDKELVARALNEYPTAISARVNMEGYPPVPPADGMHMYAYHFGDNATAHQIALHFGHNAIFDLLIEHSPVEAQFMAYCAKADENKARQILDAHPDLFERLSLEDKQGLAGAAWAHQTEVVRLMLKLGFDPHIRGAEESTPLDRAAFHGFADVIELLLEYDKNPPLEWKNKFGGMPLGACIYGVKHSWHKDGDFVRSVDLLLKAGAKAQAEWIPSGNLQVDNLLRKSLGME